MPVTRGHNLGRWWLVLTVITTFSYSLATLTYTIDELCFQTLTVNSSSSVTIEFNPGFNRTIFYYECRIRVESQNSSRRLLFRFLEFYIESPCSDSNLTVFDGDIYQPVVRGLRTALCGWNSTLTSPDTILTSGKTYVTLVFRRNDFAVKTDSTFHLRFTSFHEGPCQGVAEEYICNNSRCTDNALRCREVNPCGDNSDYIELLPFSFFELILTFFKEYIVYIAVFIGVCILWKFCSVWKRKKGEYPIIGPSLKFLCRRSRHTESRRGSEVGRDGRNDKWTSTEANGLPIGRGDSLTDSDHSEDWLENETDYLETHPNSREPSAMRSTERSEPTGASLPMSPRDDDTGYRLWDTDINVTFSTPSPDDSTSFRDSNSNLNVTLPTPARYDATGLNDSNLPPSYDEVTYASSPYAPPPSYHDVIANKDRYINSS